MPKRKQQIVKQDKNEIAPPLAHRFVPICGLRPSQLEPDYRNFKALATSLLYKSILLPLHILKFQLVVQI